MYKIDTNSATPVYQQVIDLIIEKVASGELVANDKIPSVRSLAKELGINPNTIQKAYCQLENDNVIYSLQTRGNFVSEMNLDKIHNDLKDEFLKLVAKCKSSGISKEELVNMISIDK